MEPSSRSVQRTHGSEVITSSLAFPSLTLLRPLFLTFLAPLCSHPPSRESPSQGLRAPHRAAPPSTASGCASEHRIGLRDVNWRLGDRLSRRNCRETESFQNAVTNTLCTKMYYALGVAQNPPMFPLNTTAAGGQLPGMRRGEIKRDSASDMHLKPQKSETLSKSRTPDQ